MSSLFRLFLSRNSSILRANISQSGATTSNLRYFSLNSVSLCSEKSKVPAIEEATGLSQKKDIDRTKVIPVETSIVYLISDAYKQTYGDKFVWEQYRRNHKGGFAPRKTRKTCIRKGMISTGNPCPICRDEYLVLDHRNLELLKQFISPHTGEIISYTKTGICQKKHQQLLVAVQRAMDYGSITFNVPFRKYDYSIYYSQELLAANQYQ